MKLKYLQKRRRAIGHGLAIFWLTLFSFTLVYVPLNLVMQQYQTLQQTIWPVGVFDPGTLSFMQIAWSLFLVVVLFSGVLFLYSEGQKRRPDEF